MQCFHFRIPPSSSQFKVMQQLSTPMNTSLRTTAAVASMVVLIWSGLRQLPPPWPHTWTGADALVFNMNMAPAMERTCTGRAVALHRLPKTCSLGGTTMRKLDTTTTTTILLNQKDTSPRLCGSQPQQLAVPCAGSPVVPDKLLSNKQDRGLAPM